jgi:hypothetical protein
LNLHKLRKKYNIKVGHQQTKNKLWLLAWKQTTLTEWHNLQVNYTNQAAAIAYEVGANFWEYEDVMWSVMSPHGP